MMLTHLITKAGTASFSLQSGKNEDMTTQKAVLPTGQFLTGFGYRISPGTILDFNLGFTRTSSTNPIGGVTSYGGITISLSLQFVINHKNQ
jgi:hypothetical protein